jgi:L-malate glycosyltransferase
MQKLKILMVIAAFHPYIGGAEKQAHKLAEELMQKGIEVSVVTGRWNNNLKKIEKINGLKIYRNSVSLNFLNKEKLNTDAGIFDTIILEKNIKFRKIKLFLRKLFNRFRVYFYQLTLFYFLIKHRKNYDIIHVHQVLYPAFVSALCGKILKKPVIAKVGNSGYNSDINQIKKFSEGKLQLRYIFKHITKIICTTSAMEKEFRQEGLPDYKIVKIYNGVAVENFKRSYKNCNSILFIGRFIYNKNIFILLHAFSVIINTINKDAKLMLVGDGPEREIIHNHINELGIAENTVLTGMVNNTEKYIKECDIFILPSLVEGLSNSLIEAMSYSMPCIVSNIDGNIEVIGNSQQAGKINTSDFIKTENGLLFNPEDIYGLVNAYNYLYKDEQARVKTGKGAFARIKSAFDIKLIARKYEELYKGILRQ